MLRSIELRSAIGILEYWNGGIMGTKGFLSFTSFHHSLIEAAIA